MTEVLIAISTHSEIIGGGEHSFVELLTNLPSLWRPIALVPENRGLAKTLRTSGVDCQIVPMVSLRPWLAHRFVQSILLIHKLIQNTGASIVYANTSRAALYGGIAGKLTRTPVIWHCRVGWKDPCMDRILCWIADMIIANSNATAMRFDATCGAELAIVHNGIDIKRFGKIRRSSFPMLNHGVDVLLVVARASPWKRHELAIDSFERIAGNHCNLHLVFVGGADTYHPYLWDALKRRTDQSFYCDRIHWIGHVDDPSPWYKVARIFLLPSQNEPFGRVIVEAMAAGLPVVANQGGGVPEIVRDGVEGFLVTTGNVAEMASAIERILADGQLWERLSKNAKHRARSFSLEKHISAMARIFDEIRDRYPRKIVD